MDIKKILDGVKFDYGWRVNSDYTLFNKKNDITYIFDAYEESEKINKLQKESFECVCEKEAFYSEIVKKLIDEYIENNNILMEQENIYDKITLTSMFITQEGDVLLLCEVPWDIENGIAIKIFPTYDIGPQDVFL